jgi:hypothetical protein
MSLRLQTVDLTKIGWDPSTRATQLTEDGNEPNEEILVAPVDKLTKASIDGDGVFDVLMKATKLHLTEEYDAGRITGHEYSTVYLGALTAVLQTSAQFLVNEQQVQEINARIGLIRQQTVTELANTDDNIPVGLGFNHVPNTIVPIPTVVQSGSM